MALLYGAHARTDAGPRRRSVIGGADLLADGRVALQVGHMLSSLTTGRVGDWEATERVVLTADEWHALARAVDDQLERARAESP